MAEEIVYNVVCRRCSRVWSPTTGSALWWRALKRHKDGFWDALTVSAELCECVNTAHNPNAPYRVVAGPQFDYGFDQLIPAVLVYKELVKNSMYDVLFISRFPKLTAEVEKFYG